MCAYRKAILTISMQLHAMSMRTIWSISFSIRLINKYQLGIDLIFTSKRNILQFYENIGAQYSISGKNTKDESEILQSIHTQMPTRG